LLLIGVSAVSAQVNCFFNPDDPGVLGKLDAGSQVWWNSSTSIGWKFSGSIFNETSGLQWHVHQYIASNLSGLATTGAHYNTLPWSEGELSDHFGNLTTGRLTGANASLTNAFPLITSGNQIIGRSVALKNAAGTDVACCNIGFYASGGNKTRCQFVGSPDVTGYIDFNGTAVDTNLASTSAAFNGQLASWEIRTYAIYAANCANGLPVFNNYDLAVVTGSNLTLSYSGNSDVRSFPTTTFAASAILSQSATISGRSITLHRPDGSRYATCNIGYGKGPIFDVPTPAPPPTTQPPPTGSASSLTFLSALLFALIFFVALF